jgi:hypothetical protein
MAGGTNVLQTARWHGHVWQRRQSEQAASECIGKRCASKQAASGRIGMGTWAVGGKTSGQRAAYWHMNQQAETRYPPVLWDTCRQQQSPIEDALPQVVISWREARLLRGWRRTSVGSKERGKASRSGIMGTPKRQDYTLRCFSVVGTRDATCTDANGCQASASVGTARRLRKQSERWCYWQPTGGGTGSNW